MAGPRQVAEVDDCIAARGARPVRKGEALPRVSLVISAYNEASVIVAHLRESLAHARANTTVESIAFSGARVAHRNGAGIRLEGHIFCADKGDYYDITDGDYQRPQWLAG